MVKRMNCKTKNSKQTNLTRFDVTPAVAGEMFLSGHSRKFFRPVSGMGGVADEGRERNPMKNCTLILALALAWPAATLSAQNNQPSQPGGQRPAFQERGAGGQGGQGQRPPSPLMDALDANHDGVIDAAEIANASAALKKLDKNGDGKLTSDELRPQRPDGGNPPDGAPDNQRGPRSGGAQQGPPPGNGPDEDSPNGAGLPPEDHGRPVAKIAADLGVTAEQFREAFKKVQPAPRGERPTEAQRQANRTALSKALNVSPEKLDAVMDKYRPEGNGRELGVKPSTSPRPQ